MELIPINAGNFKCDGGALFGAIPKVMWGKQMPADSSNFIKLALRCLLLDNGQQKILVETGVGNHYTEKFSRNNGLLPGNHLEASLKEQGYMPEDITDVLFTHLHWDHCNGAVKNIDGALQLTFPNAIHWCSKKQWEHSKISNAREQAAYFPGLLNFLHNSGKLNLVEKEGALFPNMEVKMFDGHTPGMMIPFISYKGKTIVYTSDLIPTAANIPLLWVASYDLFPVTTLKEKEAFLDEAAQKGYVLFFEHDFYTECATVTKGEKGYLAKEKFGFDKVHEPKILDG